MKKLILLFTTCTALAFTGCGLDSQTDSTTTSSTSSNILSNSSSDSTTSSTDSQTQPTTAPAESSPEPEETTLALGKKATIGDWKINAKSASVKNQIPNGKYQYFKPSKGNSFVVISMSVSNKGAEEAEFLPRVGYKDTMSTATLCFEDEEFQATELFAYDKDIATLKVKPSATKKGILVFDVPKKAAKKLKNLKLKFSAQGQDATYELK